jgi:Zn-dependent protease with chaperone function/Zn-finger nucleic acid-binding protein
MAEQMSTLGTPGLPVAGAAGGDAIRRFRRLEVRRERRSRRLLLFALLLGIAVLAVAMLALLFSLVLSFFEPLGALAGGDYGLFAVGLTLGLSLIAAASYWFLVQMGARERLLAAMHAQPPDPTDRYHKRFADIIEELRLASGQHQVECTVVPTTGMNAFAFSDLHGGGVVGVTEGALSRLSRDQLEAVVAHEFAHIVSGSHTTATVACLLFGIFADDEKVVSGAGPEAEAYGGQAAAAGMAGAVLATAFMALMRCGAVIVSGALSREREYAADQAAAHYTGDPLSLAMALRTIGLTSSGGYIPPGLAPLCIRDTAEGGGWLARQMAGHPPLESRINALLALANVRSVDFEAQARQMDMAAAAKEHIERPPTPAVVAPLLAALVPVSVGQGAAPSGAVQPRPASAGGEHACPSCAFALTTADYEGVRILACARCGGRWVHSADVARIVARHEVTFTEGQRRLAEELSARGIELRKAAARGALRSPDRLRACPSCRRAMIRRLYSYDHAIDIDYCAQCDSYWFDRDELEVLQVLAEGAAR